MSGVELVLAFLAGSPAPVTRAAAMADEFRVEVRKTGRGERRQTSATDLNVPVRLPLEIALTGVAR